MILLKRYSRMNCGVYMRKLQAGRTTTIGFQNGQDASQVTLKNQAKAQGVKIPVPVATNFSKIGGSVANIMEATQQTSSPTDASCTGGYKGVSYGLGNADMQANIIGAAQHCAVCSDAPSSEPYSIVLPCTPFIDPISYNPNGTTVDPSKPTPGTKPQALACTTSKDMGVIYTDNSELVADQGRQLLLRRQYNLPSKLQSLRGPIVNR
jgi:hypothetical protein